MLECYHRELQSGRESLCTANEKCSTLSFALDEKRIEMEFMTEERRKELNLFREQKEKMGK